MQPTAKRIPNLRPTMRLIGGATAVATSLSLVACGGGGGTSNTGGSEGFDGK